MDKILDLLLHPKKNPRYEELRRQAVNDFLKTSLLVCPLISIAVILFIVMSFIWPESYGDRSLLLGYRYSYMFILAGLVIYEIVLLLIDKRFNAFYARIPVLNVMALMVLMGWSLYMIMLDSYSYGRIELTLYMIVSFCIPFCFYLDLRVYLLITAVSDAFVVYLFLADGIDKAFNESNLGDFIVFIGIQIILGTITISFKHIMRERILETESQSREIQQLNESQSRFFSNMSHEIRTPINTIIGLNEMILRQNASEEINEDARNIEAASKMLLHLINDILDMSKFESGQMKLNVAPYHTGDMLSDIVGMLWIKAKEKNLEFHIDVSPELPSELYGDEVRIKQVLINVLNNAIKYTSEGSVRLSIQCERDGLGNAVVSYSVSDTGMGIRKESIPHLFTAFKRVDETKNRYIEGTGLGLSIVKNLVDLMDGKITVNSVYTKGSTFVIVIPQKIAVDDPVGELDMESGHRSDNSYTYVESFEAPEGRVLVVDDTAANLMVVTKLLKETKLTIDTASDGSEALKRTLEKEYHVILMDHLMPGMDGIECLHAIRKQIGGLCHSSKVLALTANAGGDIEAMYAREGFDGYLTKPVTGEALEKAVYNLLPRELITVSNTSQSIEEKSVDWIHEHRKKRPVRVTTGSVADIPSVLQEKHDIGVIPHIVRTGEGVFKDGIEIEPRGLLAYMRDKNAKVEAMPPTPLQMERFFSKQLDAANNIIHISLTAGVESGEYPVAMDAAEDFGNVTVIDSGHLSSGLGLMAIEAARLAEEGYMTDEIVEAMERMRGHIHTSFIVDTLEFLVRAKHVGSRMGRLADAFMVHPVVSLKKGRMKVSGVYFGTRERAWERYISSVFNVPGKIDRRMLFITYVGMTTKELEKVRQMAEKKMQFDEVFIQKASPSIAASCGPGTFGLLFFTEY